MTLSLTEIEIAWLAGLIEGEGNFGLDARSATRCKVSTAPASPYTENFDDRPRRDRARKQGLCREVFLS